MRTWAKQIRYVTRTAPSHYWLTKQHITSAQCVTQRLSQDAEGRGLTVTSAPSSVWCPVWPVTYYRSHRWGLGRFPSSSTCSGFQLWIVSLRLRKSKCNAKTKTNLCNLSNICVKTTPQNTRFRNVKYARNLGYRLSGRWQDTIRLQHPEG